jgi:hypothetical protein
MNRTFSCTAVLRVGLLGLLEKADFYAGQRRWVPPHP